MVRTRGSAKEPGATVDASGPDEPSSQQTHDLLNDDASHQLKRPAARKQKKSVAGSQSAKADNPVVPLTQRKPKGKKVAEPREALPAREGRNVHPGRQTGVQPTARRSSKEVAAERDAQRKEAEETIRKAEEAKRILAAMNIEEEKEILEETHRLSAAIRKRKRTEIAESDEGEEFDFNAMDIDDSSDSDSEPKKLNAESRTKDVESEPVQLKVVIKSKAKYKAKKGGIREDVDAITDGLRGGGEERENKRTKKDIIQTQTRKFTAIETAPQKYTDAGLRADPKSTKSKAVAKTDERVIGGLDDEDADAERPQGYRQTDCKIPKPHYPRQLHHDTTRKNEIAEVVTDDDLDSVHEPSSKQKPSQKQKAVRTAAQVDASVTQANKEKKVQAPQSNDSTAAFLQDSQWKAAFLPSLIHALYISPEPFKKFSRTSSAFLKTVQDVFDLAFPDASYKVQLKDSIFMTAYERIKSKRSFIASDTLDEVKKFFEKPEYARKSAETKMYALWALRGDGPGYNFQPTPPTCKVSQDNPAYIPPDGIFQSNFITTIARKYIKHAENSLLNPEISYKNPPMGLYALIAASIERAFTSFRKGVYIKPEAFSDDKSSSAIVFFKDRAERLSERRWKIILTDLQKDLAADCNEFEGDISVISAYRGTFYIPESPDKPCGIEAKR